MKRSIKVPAISNKLADIPPDEYSWRKYGQKPIKGSPHPRYISILMFCLMFCNYCILMFISSYKLHLSLMFNYDCDLVSEVAVCQTITKVAFDGFIMSTFLLQLNSWLVSQSLCEFSGTLKFEVRKLVYKHFILKQPFVL